LTKLCKNYAKNPESVEKKIIQKGQNSQGAISIEKASVEGTSLFSGLSFEPGGDLVAKRDR
jgi:protein subunit release factor A